MWTKPTTQRRSRETRDRILDALDGLLRERAFSALSLGDLAAASDVSAATVHQRFANKDAMATVLLALYFQRSEAWAQRARPASSDDEPTGLEGKLSRIAADAWDQIDALGHVMRPAYLLSRQRPDLVGDAWRRLEQMARDGFHGLLAAHADELPSQDLDAAADALALFFNMMALGRLLHGDEASDDDGDGDQQSAGIVADKAAFVTLLTDFAWRYLSARP